MNRQLEEVTFEARQVDTLSGGTIEHPVFDDTPGDESFGFRVVKGKKKFNVWVSRDPEGNGPGHLEIEPTA